MKFAHMSDIHLGSWSGHPDLKEMACAAFDRAMDTCISENVDFVLISGDLFDTSLPSIDVIRFAAKTLRKVHDADVSVYTIPGSHDYSPTGRTFMNVLEDAGLLVNVAKGEESGGKLKLRFTIDEKTGAKITGIMGRMGALEKQFFEQLDRIIEEEDGFKIFLFHSGIEEYKPKHLREMQAVPLSALPRNFNYYAAGHIHSRSLNKESVGTIAFPGVLYPTDFKEMEKYDSGFYLVNCEDDKIKAEHKKILMHGVEVMNIDAAGKTAEEVGRSIMASMPRDLSGKILVLRVAGVMNGRPSDIDFRRIYAKAMENGAISVKRNTSKLAMKEFEKVALGHSSTEEIEKQVVHEHLGKMKLGSRNIEPLILALMKSLDDDKQEGETNYVFEDRIKKNALEVFNL